jgi:putative CocE/NonD family hydrolase
VRRRAAALGLAGLALAGYAISRRGELIARAAGLRPAQYAVAFEQDIPVPMPDGVTLYADRLSPRTPGHYPTILIRTPYGRPSETRLLGSFAAFGAHLFAERGYNVVVQGVRGRFRSEGAFEPFRDEAADGRATLDWVARQPWFEGNLGMWGPSYLGYTQWAVAADAPPFLKVIVPVVTASRFSRPFYPGDGFALESSLRWANVVRSTHRPGRALDLSAAWALFSPARQAAIARVMGTHPLGEADRASAGDAVPFYQRWLVEDPDGPYWRQIDHHRTLAKVDVPVHLVAGWYDIFLHEQLADYAALLAAGRTPYLTVLPYHHNHPNLVLAAAAEGLRWLDYHLKGHRDAIRRRPVRLALMGSSEWHEMDFWPPPADVTRYYLHGEGMLSTHDPAPESLPSRYRYDPRDPTPSIGGPVLSPQGGPRPQNALEARTDLLCFTTPPLHEEVDVIGHVRLELYVRSSLQHTDFVGRLCDVAPDGRSVNVCEGICRVAPGKGEPQPDGSLKLDVDMWATAQRFRAGHQIRLHVASAAHPRWAANSGDGRPLPQSGATGTPADQTVYHDRAHPSALFLPIVSARTRERMASLSNQPTDEDVS